MSATEQTASPKTFWRTTAPIMPLPHVRYLK